MKIHTILIASLALVLSGCAGTSGTATAGSGSVRPYPEDTCIVSGNKLGSMGDPITMVHNGQEVKFCCRPCVKKFQADPEKYLAGLR